MRHKLIGRQGEAAAERYLKKQGYKILERNACLAAGEADLIAQKGSVIVFVEVKAREGTAYGAPIEAVTGAKIRRYLKLAEEYLVKNRLYGQDVRFDVIAVQNGEIEHIENAFDAGDKRF